MKRPPMFHFVRVAGAACLFTLLGGAAASSQESDADRMRERLAYHQKRLEAISPSTPMALCGTVMHPVFAEPKSRTDKVSVPNGTKVIFQGITKSAYGAAYANISYTHEGQTKLGYAQPSRLWRDCAEQKRSKDEEDRQAAAESKPAAPTPVAAAASSSCSKDDVIKMIDKGFDKATIDDLCSRTAKAAPAAPAGPKDIVLEMLNIAEKGLATPVDYDSAMRRLGLSIDINEPAHADGFYRTYVGVVPELNVSARFILGPGLHKRQAAFSDNVPPRDSSAKQKYYVLLEVARKFSQPLGMSLETQPDTYKHIPECQGYSFGWEMLVGGAGVRLNSGKGLIVHYDLGRSSRCRERNGDVVQSEFPGTVSLQYHNY